jgi:hypothetical protein
VSSQVQRVEPVKCSTRYVFPNGKQGLDVEGTMREAITPSTSDLLRTVTWDQGQGDSSATGVPISFCDPHTQIAATFPVRSAAWRMVAGSKVELYEQIKKSH